jgi:hypothetical protein
MQAMNKRPPPVDCMRPILASQGFSQQDADILAILARHVLIARSNATKFAICQRLTRKHIID